MKKKILYIISVKYMKQKHVQKRIIICTVLLYIFLYITGCGSDPGREVIELNLFRDVIDLVMPSEEEDVNPPDEEMQCTETEPQSQRGLHYYYSSQSSQDLNYIVYTPTYTDSTTPIFLFLHGNGETGREFSQVYNRYIFLQRLENGSWEPNVIIIMPLNPRKSHWAEDLNNVNTIITETIYNFGGSRDNMYIAGASAGADDLTYYAQNMNFKGAIYMAGHINGNNLSASELMNLWSGKNVYYYRDNLLANGGYGYNSSLVSECRNIASSYNVNFQAIDLNWNHDIGLVDATFLPECYVDKLGQTCHNGILKLIYGE